jgi:GH25 family lysozyme M1 (1,4-beta-N-acetylmuramidase)
MEATGLGARRASAGGRRARIGLACAVALCTAILVVVPAPHAEAAARTRVPGIDVSRWQGDVNWSAVASTPVRFVIMRATRGNAYNDPMYSEYLAGASANGLVVGAYHRAKVGIAPGDAKDEADHFVNVARNAAGDVLPVLDIEDANGLGVPRLTDWVRDWLTRVYARTGVRAMIYSSPYFWRTYLGDTTWFADHGYPLWIAHWGVSAPSIPAGGWGGHGWTYWQWTSVGRVSGIGPNVDRDRINGFGLLRGKIASLRVRSPAGGVITGARIACGRAASKCTRLANPYTVLTLAATPGPGARLLRWTGACSAAGSSPTCDVTALGAKTVSAVFGYPVRVDLQGSGGGNVSSTPARIACGANCAAFFAVGSTVNLTAHADSASAFVGWRGGGCSAAGLVCGVTVSSPRHVVATFDSVVSVEQGGTGTSFGWGRASHPRAIGGSYRWERRSGASATYAFSGGAVTLFTVSGPMMGRGRIVIDGAAMDTFDGYSRVFVTGVAHRFESLGPGAHTLKVVVLGTKRPIAAGTRVAVDALRWGGHTRADPAPASARWATVTNASASGGSYAISDARDAFTRLRFRGTGGSVRTLRGPGMGRAEVWVDGALVKVVDLYAPTTAFAAMRLVSGLADGPHTVRIVALGTHRLASSGNGVVVDRWLVV